MRFALDMRKRRFEIPVEVIVRLLCTGPVKWSSAFALLVVVDDVDVEVEGWASTFWLAVAVTAHRVAEIVQRFLSPESGRKKESEHTCCGTLSVKNTRLSL